MAIRSQEIYGFINFSVGFWKDRGRLKKVRRGENKEEDTKMKRKKKRTMKKIKKKRQGDNLEVSIIFYKFYLPCISSHNIRSPH